MSTSRNLLRWFAVLPAGIISGVIVSFPIHWVVMTTFGGWSPEPVIEIGNIDTLRKIEEMLQMVFGPLAFVYFGSQAAPSYRLITSVLLAGVIVLGAPIAIYLWNMNEASNGLSLFLEHSPIKMVANIIGCAGAIYLIHFREQQKLDSEILRS